MRPSRVSSTSNGLPRWPIAPITSPSGSSVGTSLSECTAASIRPSRRASSSSLVNTPLPPIAESGRSRSRSPPVTTLSVVISRLAWAAASAVPTTSAWASASALPRVPMRRTGRGPLTRLLLRGFLGRLLGRLLAGRGGLGGDAGLLGRGPLVRALLGLGLDGRLRLLHLLAGGPHRQGDARLLEQRLHLVRRHRADRQPVGGTLGVDLELGILGLRVVVPELVHETAIARRLRLRDHDAELGVLLGAHAPQTNDDSHDVLFLQGTRARRRPASGRNRDGVNRRSGSPPCRACRAVRRGSSACLSAPSSASRGCGPDRSRAAAC